MEVCLFAPALGCPVQWLHRPVWVLWQVQGWASELHIAPLPWHFLQLHIAKSVRAQAGRRQVKLKQTEGVSPVEPKALEARGVTVWPREQQGLHQILFAIQLPRTYHKIGVSAHSITEHTPNNAQVTNKLWEHCRLHLLRIYSDRFWRTLKSSASKCFQMLGLIWAFFRFPLFPRKWRRDLCWPRWRRYAEMCSCGAAIGAPAIKSVAICAKSVSRGPGVRSVLKCSQHHFAANVQYPCRQVAKLPSYNMARNGRQWYAMCCERPFYSLSRCEGLWTLFRVAKQPRGKWNNALECFSEDFDANSDKQTTTIPRSVQVPECSRTCLLCCGLPDSTSKFRRLCAHVVCVLWVNYEYYSFKYVLSMF